MELNKTVRTMFLILCLIFLIFFTEHRVNADVSLATWVVDVGGLGDFTSIQEAVNHANVGDTIFVSNGTYNENVVINKTLSIIGENLDSTIIVGHGNDSVVSIITTSNVSISGFTITNSSIFQTDGIHIEASSGVVVSHNKIRANTNGIGLYASNHNVISDNIMFYNDFSGIFPQSSGENAIYGNTFFSNGVYGVYLLYSDDNTIYHNNFNNTQQTAEQVSSYNSRNYWDHDGEGNYWVDYTGQDANGDGLGDTPYVISDDNPDNHPLMGAFSIFAVTAAEGTYDVAVVSNSTIPRMVFEIGAETRNRILRFNATGPSGTFGFCRIALPNELMQYPYTLLIGGEEAAPTFVGSLNGANIIYFAYLHTNVTINIISSEVLRLYTELLGNFSRLQTDFYGLNASYYDLLDSFGALSANYTQLQDSFRVLNESYQQLYGLNASYYDLLDSFSTLQIGFNVLNTSYVQLLSNYTTLQTSLSDLNSAYSGLSGIYSVLRNDFVVLNASYHSLLSLHVSILENYTRLQGSYNDLNNSYSEQLQNLQSLMYIIVAITTVFIITTVYLSMQVHKNKTAKRIAFEDEE